MFLKFRKNASCTYNNTAPLWVRISAMHNTYLALDTVGRRALAVVTADREVMEAVSNLKYIKNTITEYGATESLIASINEGNQFTEAIGFSMPQLNALNATAVGIACCESIDNAIGNTCALIIAFFDKVKESADQFINCIGETSAAQVTVLTSLQETVLSSIDTIDADAFASEEICGYAQPVFVERLGAIATILDTFDRYTDDTTDYSYSVSEFQAPLKVLGKVLECSIKDETEEEAIAEAPPTEEVMNTEVIEAETPATEDLDAVETPEEVVPADACQQQPIAVFKWTPSNISEAVSATRLVLCKVNKLAKIRTIIDAAAATVTPDCNPTSEDIDVKRDFVGVLVELTKVVSSSLCELVDQLVAMCGKLKKTEVHESAPSATPVEEITQDAPLGVENKKKVIRRRRPCAVLNEGTNIESPEFNPDKQDVEPAGELPDDTEGPTEAEDTPSAEAKRKKFKKKGAQMIAYFDEEEEIDTDEVEETTEEETEEEAAEARRKRLKKKTRNYWNEDEVIEEPVTVPIESDDEDEDDEEETTESRRKRLKKKTRNYWNEDVNPDTDVSDNEFDSEDQDSEPAGALEDDEEGPTEAEDTPSAEAKRKKFKKTRNYTNDDEVIEEPVTVPIESDDEDDEETEEEAAEARRKKFKKKTRNYWNEDEDGEAEEDSTDEDDEPEVESKRKKLKKKTRNYWNEDTPVDADGEPVLNPDQDEDDAEVTADYWNDDSNTEEPKGLDGAEPEDGPDGADPTPGTLTEPIIVPVATPQDDQPDHSADEVMEARRKTWF